MMRKDLYPLSSELTIYQQLFESKIASYNRIMTLLCSYFQKVYRLGAAPPPVSATPLMTGV